MSDAPPPAVSLTGVAAEELGEVSAMAARIWPAAYGEILPPGQIDFMLERMYAPERLRRDLAEGVDLFWVRSGPERIGFLAAGPLLPGASCPLHKCYLLPEFQGAGLGSAALGLLCARFAEAGARAIELRVNRHNAAAIAFYRKNGFTVSGEDCREIGGGFVMDDYLMRRDLRHCIAGMVHPNPEARTPRP